MAVTLQAEYYYIDGVQQASPSYGWAGYNTSNKKYYVSVAKYYTDSYISAPTFALYTGGTDNTNSSKQLGVYFVACSANSTPNNTIIKTPSQIANNHQTRIRFGYTYYSNGTYSSYNNTSWGYGQTSSSLIIAPGYFFVYVGTAQATSHTYSSHYTINSKYYPAKLTYSTPTIYTISYDANQGAGLMSSQTVVAGQSVNLLTNGFTAPTNRLYTVTLNGNGGKNGTPTYNNPPNAFYRWLEGSTSGSSYEAGASYKPQQNITFYAQWYTPTVMGSTTRDSGKTNGYTVTLNANGGNCDTSSLTAKDTVTYKFNGWNSKSDGSGSDYDTTSTYVIASTRTLYAKWTEKVQTGTGTVSLPSATNSSSSNKTITLNYQGATGGNSTSTTTYKKTTTKAFKGWGTSSSATSGITGTYKPPKDIILYAVWGSATYSYSTISLPTPTKTGYTFMGWATSESASSGSIGSFTPTTDVTVLYAIWEPDGNIRIYVDGTYKIALAYIYAPSSSSDTRPWKLTLVYLNNPSSSSDTKPWKLIAG